MKRQRSRPSQSLSENPLHDLVVAYLRHTLVLAKLKALSKEKKTEIEKDVKSLEELAKEIQADLLFSKREESKVRLPLILAEKWETKPKPGMISFATTKENPLLNSVYESRGFFGLSAPANFALRLKGLVEEWKKGHAPPSGKQGVYDKHIAAWGRYAYGLVWENGGWNVFFQKENLKDINDYWPVGRSPRTGTMEHVRGKSIERVLALDRNRYVQILAAPMGMLWPLWFLRNKTLRDWLKNSDTGQRIGPKLKGNLDDFFIDVNVRVGDLAQLPYPFSYADGALVDALGQDKVDSMRGECWYSGLVDEVAKQLMTEKWNPPILFAGRANQWDADAWHATEEAPNFPTAHLSIAVAFPDFASIWKKIAQRSAAGEGMTDVKIAFENGTWAKKAIEALLEYGARLNPEGNTRPDLFKLCLTGAKNFDFVFSTFPADLAFAVADKTPPRSMKRLDWHESDSDFYKGEQGVSVAPRQASTVLASGVFLARQPRMASLLIDLGICLAKAIACCRQLRPVFDKQVQKNFRCLRFGNQHEKVQAAQEIADRCDIAKGEKLLTASFGKESLKIWFHEIGKDMLGVLWPDETKNANLMAVLHEWAWAAFLEYVYYSDITASLELFTGGET